jgi:AcrR family transcriptional regulator
MAEQMRARRGAAREPLSRERVLRAAISLADDEGLEALSMRKLAKALGVEAMSLYNHVANKRDLLSGMLQLVSQEIEDPVGGDWRDDLRRYAISSHDVLLRHGWAANLSLSPSVAAPGAVQRAEWLLRRLRKAGFSADVTYHAFHALEAHILGFTLWQLGHGIRSQADVAPLVEDFLRAYPRHEYPYMHEHVQQHMDGVSSQGKGAFELVLDLILDGLEEMRDAA